MMYSMGNVIRFGLFGKSHGDHVGCLLENVPAGIRISLDEIKKEMELRKPKDGIGTPRKEDDDAEIVSGITAGVTDGKPIRIIIANRNADSSAYRDNVSVPRPGHADLPAMVKWKDHDVRGGGQFSGRLTAPIVAAGSIAKQMLAIRNIRVSAFTRSVGNVRDTEERNGNDAVLSRRYQTRACSSELDMIMRNEIMNASEDGDSVGGIVECIVTGLPIGFGGIWFDSLDAMISKAVFGIPAVKGIEFGRGFGLAGMRGSESNDQYHMNDGIKALTNNMGGIVGGMSNGMPLSFRVAFKPTPSISREQRSVDLRTMKDTVISVKGRHDPCIVPRAVAVVEAVTALVLADAAASEDASAGGLESLRKSIRNIDSQIVRLMAERNDAARMIGELKKEKGLPLRNTDVEDAVVSRYAEMAEGTSLSKKTAESVCRTLISGSVELQSKILRKKFEKKMTVIGGRGAMGKWLTDYFRSLGADVRCIDIDTGTADMMRDADVVVISVPISSVGTVLDDADRLCRKDALIFDIASVKSPFSEKLKRMAKRRKVCSVHPMFGPSAVSMTDRNVIVCDCGCDEAVEEAVRLFDNDGANIVVTDADHHDLLMAYVLAFSHASGIVLMTALRDSGIPFRELNNAASVTFSNVLGAAAPISKENASLYHEIQRLNANTEEMWDVYEKAVKEVRDASLSENGKRFAELMKEGNDYLERL